MRLSAIIVFLLFQLCVRAQNRDAFLLDSLGKALTSPKEDTATVNGYSQLSRLHSAKKDTLGYINADKGLKLAEKIGFEKGALKSLLSVTNYYMQVRRYDKCGEYIMLTIRRAGGQRKYYSELGQCYFYKATVAARGEGDINKGLALFDSSIAFYKQANFEKGLAAAYNNAGDMYRSVDNFPKALEFLLASMELRKKYNDEPNLALVYGNLGLVYEKLGQFPRSVSYHLQSIALSRKTGNLTTELNELNNLGNAYFTFKHNDSALHYYKTAYELAEKNPAQEFILARITNNLGNVYRTLGNLPLAMKSFRRALELKRKANDEAGICVSLINIAALEINEKHFQEGMKLLDEAMVLAKKAAAVSVQKDICEAYYDLYFMKQDYKEALNWYTKRDALKDSLYNEQNSRVIAEMNSRYESEKKERENELLKKEVGINDIKLQKEQAAKLYLLIFAGLVVALSAVMFYAYLGKTKNNRLLAEKNLKIELQKTEITDSINYAKKIQEAILPSKELLDQRFADNFVLYKPKDIVSGDFYFLKRDERPGSNALYVAVADCTGHGVPGAFMSLIGHKELEMAVAGNGTPARILAELNKGVKNTLKQNDLEGTRDGMDIALCRMEGTKAEYAGANRALWIVRANGGFEELKPTKCAIGGLTSSGQEFQNHVLTLQPGDCLYLSTDGLADQFGGDKNKKITTKKLKQFLIENHQLPMAAQGEKLQLFFREWKGSYEQIDDVLMIGIKWA